MKSYLDLPGQVQLEVVGDHKIYKYKTFKLSDAMRPSHGDPQAWTGAARRQ